MAQFIGMVFQAISLWFSAIVSAIGHVVVQYPVFVAVAMVLLAGTVIVARWWERKA